MSAYTPPLTAEELASTRDALEAERRVHHGGQSVSNWKYFCRAARDCYHAMDHSEQPPAAAPPPSAEELRAAVPEKLRREPWVLQALATVEKWKGMARSSARLTQHVAEQRDALERRAAEAEKALTETQGHLRAVRAKLEGVEDALTQEGLE